MNNFVRSILDRLVKINDSPQKIAMGFGLGVFLGIFPGAGPIASVVLSSLLRVNSVAALTGSLLTNTWISVVTFAAAVKVGAAVTGADWQKIYQDCKGLMEHFSWKDLLDVSILQILYPVFLGYILVGLLLASISSLIVYAVFKIKKAD